jgi:anti-anti-sigma factor
LIRPEEFQVQREQLAPGVCRLTPAGELDLAAAPQLEAEVEAALAAAAEQLVIDMSHISFIDSTGLRLFLVLQERSTAAGWQLTLTRPSEAVRSILEITGAGETLPLVDDWRGGS